jgi:hypothetical protein
LAARSLVATASPDRSGLAWSLSALFPAAAERDALRLAARPSAQVGVPPGSRSAEDARRQRTKLWEFGANLHCSIVGTCLSTGELRQVLVKSGAGEASSASEHDVHAAGVRTAARQQGGARLLHKALDRRHRLAINRFARAAAEDEVRALWREAVQNGDIPGAYWAALTHPAASDALVREIFAEVHMLSHLVGAANRADIRRLRQLEAERAALEAKVTRQQRQLRDAVVTRDATIRSLNRALEARLTGDRDGAAGARSEPAPEAWEALAGDLQHRLAASEERRERAERLLGEARLALDGERRAREAAEQREQALQREAAAIETALAGDDEIAGEAPSSLPRLDRTLLYVGGRPAGIGRLRRTAERRGAVFLHHDGGLEEREGLLPGLVSRADAVLFPTDCVSHAAMSLVKRLCRQAGKPLLPLRSAGLAPFCAALGHPALAGGSGAP